MEEELEVEAEETLYTRRRRNPRNKRKLLVDDRTKIPCSDIKRYIAAGIEAWTRIPVCKILR